MSDPFAPDRAQAQQANRLAVQSYGIPGRGDEFERRFRCLDLAIRSDCSADPVRLAGQFYDFATGKDDRNVREQVLDALNKAGVN